MKTILNCRNLLTLESAMEIPYGQYAYTKASPQKTFTNGSGQLNNSRNFNRQSKYNNNRNLNQQNDYNDNNRT